MAKEFPNKVRLKTADAFEKELMKRGWTRVRAPYDASGPADNHPREEEIGSYPLCPEEVKMTYADIAARRRAGGKVRDMFVKPNTYVKTISSVVCGLEYPDGIEYVLTNTSAQCMVGVHPVEITHDKDGCHPDGRIENELMGAMKTVGALVTVNG